MEEKTYKFKLKIKDVEKVFIKGEEPGVFVTAEMTYTNSEHKKNFKSALYAQLLRTEEKFIKKHIKVLREEIK